jgi:hypothetical protein
MMFKAHAWNIPYFSILEQFQFTILLNLVNDTCRHVGLFATLNGLLPPDMYGMLGQVAGIAKAYLRPYVKAYLTYITDADKENMGLPLHDAKPTPVPPPATYPEAETDSSVIRQLTIHFKDNGSEKRAKPKGAHGAEIRWSILDHTPATVDELTTSAFMREEIDRVYS